MVNQLTILGIIFSSNFHFKTHSKYITSKCLSLLGLIFKICRDFNNTHIPIRLYKTLIIPIISYGLIIWYPHQQYLQKLLEKINRKFIKFYTYKFNLSFLYDFSYEDRLSNLSLTNFNSIYISNQINFISKLRSNKINAPHLLSLLSPNIPKYNLRFTNLFYISKPKTNYISPITKAIEAFNKLSSNT